MLSGSNKYPLDWSTKKLLSHTLLMRARPQDIASETTFGNPSYKEGNIKADDL